MKYISLISGLLINTLFVVGKSIDINNNNLSFVKAPENIISNIVDFNDICDMHYNKNVTDEQISTLLSNAISFAITNDILNNNISDIEKVGELKSYYVEKFITELEEHDASYRSTGLAVRGCPWYKKIACSAGSNGAMLGCFALLPPADIACAAGISTIAVLGCKDCLQEVL